MMQYLSARFIFRHISMCLPTVRVLRRNRLSICLFSVLIQLYSGQSNECSRAACFKLTGHFALLRDQTLNGFSQTT